jgi:hypothetical protein
MERAVFHVAMAPFNSINGFMLCCVHMTLSLILAPVVARPITKILRCIGKASGICEAKQGASSVDVDPIVSNCKQYFRPHRVGFDLRARFRCGSDRALVSSAQSDRKSEDIFLAYYRMNTLFKTECAVSSRSL